MVFARFARSPRGGLILFCLVICGSQLHAAVHLPRVVAEHMVVQRGLPVHVWGSADVGEAVAVTFRGQTQQTKADDLGKWSIFLPPGEAGGPFELKIRASNELLLPDVLVGDVWVASGQSNMEFRLKQGNDAASEIAAANYPKIRLFQAEHKAADYPLEDIAAKAWAVCDPKSAADFSAIAYFFARNIQGKIGVPIGLIETDWGGTPADAWTSLPALSADASLMPVFAEWGRLMQRQATTLAIRDRELNKWRIEIQQAKAQGKPAPDRPWMPNENDSWKPAGLFNAMIAPLTPFPIRGVIWYQGESNTSSSRAPIYANLFQTMIRDWRHAWGEGDFPFLFVQLANFTTSPDSMWPEVREAQRQTLGLANTGMAVTIDVGNATDIHPKNKQDVGLRLALAARAGTYGEKVEYSGPTLLKATADTGSVRLYFDHAEGLAAKGGTLKSFEVAGKDGKFANADARIEGTTIVVSSASVAAPFEVRYGWASNPDCNLFNGAGLPASPFRATAQ